MNTSRAFIAIVALLAAVATSASGAVAFGARTGASPFELTLETALTPPLFMSTEGGTFRSGAPFCGSGRFVEFDNAIETLKWRFTCDDGTGSLTVGLLSDGTWRIIDGSGSYAGFRGEGSMQGEQLCRPWLGESCDLGKPIPWRGTLVGVVDPEAVDPENVPPTNADTVAPTIGFSTVNVRKLARPAGSYLLDVAIALRDDVEGAPISYVLRVTPTTSARELATRVGTTSDGAASMTMRVRYYKPPRRTVLLRLSASDEAGNESSVTRVLRLPR